MSDLQAQIIGKLRGGIYKRGFLLALIVVFYVLLITNLEYVPTRLSAMSIIKSAFPPDWSYAGSVFKGMMESINMAVVGTVMAAVLAIPFGFLAAFTVTGKKGSQLTKTLLNADRSFPELLLAIIFVRAVGLGPFAGVLALGLHSIGTLGKLYSEVVEAIDPNPVEGVRATGANSVATTWFAVLPQVLPEFVSYALYRFEINVRAATVLGFVGAGGIGKPLILNISYRNWDKVAMIMIVIVVAVTLIDAISGWLRSKLV